MILGAERWFWVWGHGPGLEEMNSRRGNCPSRAQRGGPGHGKGILGKEVVLDRGRGSWAREGDDPGHGCSELGNSLVCGEQELTPLLDKQVWVGQ